MKDKKMKKKKGFTLAETLIAMALLGIVAAVSVPTLIMATDKNSEVDGLKRAYLTLKTATGELMLDNSGSITNITTDSNTLITKLCTKLVCIKKCSAGSSGCFQQSRKWLGGLVDATDPTASYSSAILSNGMLLLGEIDDSTCSGGGSNNQYTYNAANIACGSVWVDVNGFKSPNQFGRDIFMFRLTKNGLYADGLKGFTDMSTYCSTSVNGALNGAACSGRILTEGAMNY